ncbi:hypothetical protein C3E98_014105 [Pseudomonas sp. MWU13-2625]|nr:hypothetical protein C3E98_014105 [Pseudomonas sp. MWU13-2625]
MLPLGCEAAPKSAIAGIGSPSASSGSKLPRHSFQVLLSITCAAAFSTHDSDKPQLPAACAHRAVRQ